MVKARDFSGLFFSGKGFREFRVFVGFLEVEGFFWWFRECRGLGSLGS